MAWQKPDPVMDIHSMKLDRVFVHNMKPTHGRMPGLEQSAEVTLRENYQLQEMMIEIRAHVLAMPYEKVSVHRKWPKDWWDAFKDRWFPKWALRRWPVRYSRIDIEQTIYAGVCPHIADDPMRKHVEWMWMQGQNVKRHDV